MRVVCEWALQGVQAWAETASVFVIVDVMSFSTAVAVAVERGARIIPFPYGDQKAIDAESKRRGVRAASPRRALGGQLSLSPASLRALGPGETLILPSPNGSRLSLETAGATTLAGSLRNARAVAGAVRRAAGDGLVVVIAAGERWPDRTLRPAIEDWLGAGAVIDAIAGDESAEAELARLTFLAARDRLGPILRDSLSGRELIGRGFGEDVDIASQLDVSDSVPILIDGMYVAAP